MPHMGTAKGSATAATACRRLWHRTLPCLRSVGHPPVRQSPSPSLHLAR
jgi:hypothetical protein